MSDAFEMAPHYLFDKMSAKLRPSVFHNVAIQAARTADFLQGSSPIGLGETALRVRPGIDGLKLGGRLFGDGSLD